MRANELFQALFSKSKTSNTISVTYSELISLMNSNKLIPQIKYRITDYVSVFEASSITLPDVEGEYGDETEADVLSREIPFDIIVTARSQNALYEECTAARNENDNGYFASSKLEEWKLKYAPIVNEENGDYVEVHAQWVPEENKGFIYYMKDEFGNEAPFDFKNFLWSIDDVQYPVLGAKKNNQLVDGTLDGTISEVKVQEHNDYDGYYIYPPVKVEIESYMSRTIIGGSTVVKCRAVENCTFNCTNYSSDYGYLTLIGETGPYGQRGAISNSTISCERFTLVFSAVGFTRIVATMQSGCHCTIPVYGVDMFFSYPVFVDGLPNELDVDHAYVSYSLYGDGRYEATIIRPSGGDIITYHYSEDLGTWTKKTITAE